jgi:hypothetical protein
MLLFIFFYLRQSAQSPDIGRPYLMLPHVNFDAQLGLFSTDKFKVIHSQPLCWILDTHPAK